MALHPGGRLFMIRPMDRHALKLPNNRMLTKASAVFVLFPTSHQMHNQSNELKVRNSATSRRHSILPKAAQTRHSTRYDVDCALTRPTTGRCLAACNGSKKNLLQQCQKYTLSSTAYDSGRSLLTFNTSLTASSTTKTQTAKCLSHAPRPPKELPLLVGLATCRTKAELACQGHLP